MNANIKTIGKGLCLSIALASGLAAHAQLVDVDQDFKYFGCVGDFRVTDIFTGETETQEKTTPVIPGSDDESDPYLYVALQYMQPLEIAYSDKQLTLTTYVHQKCFDQSVTTYVKRSGNIIWFQTKTYEIGNSPTYNCDCTKKASSTVKDIEPGYYYIIANDAVYIAELLGKVDKVLGLENMLIEPYIARNDAEWVFYREGAGGEDPLFVRMRMKETPYPYSLNKEHKLYYCVGDYDESRAVWTGEVWLNTPSRLGLNLIPLEHPFAKGEDRYPLVSDDPASWDNPVSCMGIGATYSFNAEPGMVWDFSKWWAQSPQVVDIKETKVDGRPSLHYFFDNGLQLVYGVGPVGTDYASNFCYPAFDLPEGEAPLRFLYMRSLKDDHIIYGDPTLDPSYKGSAKLTEANDSAWIENAVELGIEAEGEGEVMVYSLNGQLIASQHGIDRVTIGRSQLDAGIYIVVATANGLHLTRKIRI